jgi:hypothetical protein
MDDALLQKKARHIAAGYAIMALLFFGMCVVLLGAGGWHGLGQVMRNLAVIGKTLALVFGLFVINSLLALGSWRLLAFSPRIQKLVVVAASALACVAVVNNLVGWWRWYTNAVRLPSETEPSAMGGSTLLTLAYALSAYSLVRLLSELNRQRGGTTKAP